MVGCQFTFTAQHHIYIIGAPVWTNLIQTFGKINKIAVKCEEAQFQEVRTLHNDFLHACFLHCAS